MTLGSGGFFIGNNPGGVGTANFSGGTFTGTTGATVVAVRNQGTISVSGSANVTLATLQMGLAAAAPNTTSTVNLDGGRLTVDQVIRDTGTASFSFNGGTLAARGNTSAFMTGLSRAEVRSGGAVIDTGTFAITIGQNLLSSTSSPGGGLTKLGAGTLTLSGSSSYTGGTVVSAGTLSITNSNALGKSGTVVLGNAATGSSAVTLRSTVDLARDITVSSSGSGVARIEGDTNFITYSGGLALNRPTTLGGTSADRYGVSGRISGPVGTLTIDAPRVTFDQTAANANTFTGSVAINPGRILQLNSPHGLSGSHAVTANGLFYLNLWGVTGTNLGVRDGHDRLPQRQRDGEHEPERQRHADPGGGRRQCERVVLRQSRQRRRRDGPHENRHGHPDALRVEQLHGQHDGLGRHADHDDHGGLAGLLRRPAASSSTAARCRCRSTASLGRQPR